MRNALALVALVGTGLTLSGCISRTYVEPAPAERTVIVPADPAPRTVAPAPPAVIVR